MADIVTWIEDVTEELLTTRRITENADGACALEIGIRCGDTFIAER